MIPYKHKSERLSPILDVTSVVDRLGNIYYSIEYKDNDNKMCCCRFKNMSSVVDFISSNFK